MILKRNIAVSESGFLFNPTSGDSYSLNPTGQFILNYLKEGKSLDEIKSLIVEEFSTDAIMVEKDLYDFIQVLKNFKLIDNG